MALRPVSIGGNSINMVTPLMARALHSLNSQLTAQSLSGTASEIVDFCGNVQKHPLGTCLERYGLSCPGRLDGWAVPDAIWTAISRRRPQLNCYPLGEIAERAAKKTIVALTLQAGTRSTGEPSLNLHEPETEKNLRRSLSARGIDGLLKLFLGLYFFEICIDNLRRPREGSQQDFGFWYHFSREGDFVSLAAEQKLRQTLEDQCDEKAGIFLPFLKGCLEEKNFARIEQRISDGFAQVFGAQVPTGAKVEDTNKPFVNVIVGTRSLAELRRKSFAVSKKRKRFLLHTRASNISFSFDALESCLGHDLHSLIKDLLDIGVIVYMSDQYTKRERHLGRRIGIVMPVRHPEIWSRAHTEVERAVSFLGRDDFSIHFVKRKERRDQLRGFPVKSDSRCVCLLSGGVDSLAGAVWALERGLKPILVSHHAGAQLAGIQTSLVDELGKIYRGRLRHVSVYARRAKGKKVKYRLPAPLGGLMAQHLRSFLFLSLATAVALESRVNKVYVLENGPVALNPLISEARVNTRTAHPHFLEHFRALIKAVFGVDLIIENPFLYYTKGEVTRILAKPKLQPLLAKTNSCWNWFKVLVIAKQLKIPGFKGSHDGECLPCVLRRTAVHYANLWTKDSSYLIDVFTQFPRFGRDISQERENIERRHITTAIADFLGLCQNTKALSGTELLLRAPDLSVYEEGADSQKLVAMYKRHAEEVICCFRERSNPMFRKVFAAVLPEPRRGGDR